MKNTLGDLNNHLFAMLEKLDDDELIGDKLDTELKRADAMSKIAGQIIQNGQLQLNTMKHMDDYGYKREKNVPEMLEVKS